MLQPKNRTYQRGVGSLIELTIILAIGIAVAAALLRTDSKVFGIQQRESTTRVVEKISTGMDTFVRTNGRLPCPADPQQARTNANFGVEQRNSATGRCTQTGGILSGTTAANEVLYMGMLPFRTLRMPPVTDGYNNRINYVVPELNANSTSVGQGQGLRLLRSFTPGSNQNMQASNIMLDNAPYLLLSSGANSACSYSADGGDAMVPARKSTTQSPGGTQTQTAYADRYVKDSSNEDKNCIDDGTKLAGVLGNVFVLPPAPTATTSFDDQLKAGTLEELCRNGRDENVFFGSIAPENIIAWYSSECRLMDATNTTNVTRLYDRSGHTPPRDAVQTTTANMPEIRETTPPAATDEIVKLNGVRTRPVIYFDTGANVDTMASTQGLGASATAPPITFFTVAQADGAGGQNRVFQPSSAVSGHYQATLSGGSGASYDPDGTAANRLTATAGNSTLRTAATEMNLFSFAYTASNTAGYVPKLTVNGADSTARTGTANATQNWPANRNITLGSATASVPMRFGEMVMLQGYICQHDKRRLERYLANPDRWNITLGFAPQDGLNDIYRDANLTNGELAFWYDASNLCSLMLNNTNNCNQGLTGAPNCADDTAIQSWLNLSLLNSATARDTTPLTGAPHIRFGRINSLPALEFTSDPVTAAVRAVARPMTIFMVVQNPAGTMMDAGGFTLQANTGAKQWQLGPTTMNIAAGANVGDFSATKATLHTITIDASGATSYYIAGSENTNGGGSADRNVPNDPANTVSGSIGTGITDLTLGQGSFTGDIAEVLVYEGAVLPSDQRGDVEEYLARKWSTCLQKDNTGVKYDTVKTGQPAPADLTLCEAALPNCDTTLCNATQTPPCTQNAATCAPTCTAVGSEPNGTGGCRCAAATPTWNGVTGKCETASSCPQSAAEIAACQANECRDWDAATCDCKWRQYSKTNPTLACVTPLDCKSNADCNSCEYCANDGTCKEKTPGVCPECVVDADCQQGNTGTCNKCVSGTCTIDADTTPCQLGSCFGTCSAGICNVPGAPGSCTVACSDPSLVNPAGNCQDSDAAANDVSGKPDISTAPNCTCICPAHSVIDGAGNCICDTAKGYSKDASGNCVSSTCTAPKVPDGSGGCKCPNAPSGCTAPDCAYNATTCTPTCTKSGETWDGTANSGNGACVSSTTCTALECNSMQQPPCQLVSGKPQCNGSFTSGCGCTCGDNAKYNTVTKACEPVGCSPGNTGQCLYGGTGAPGKVNADCSCSCPCNSQLDTSNKNSCVCSGGRVWGGYLKGCYCPMGEWNGSSCSSSCSTFPCADGSDSFCSVGACTVNPPACGGDGGTWVVNACSCICSMGRVWNSLAQTCDCPTGSYWNPTKKLCQSCPLGQHNNRSGSCVNDCTIAPSGTCNQAGQNWDSVDCKCY